MNLKGRLRHIFSGWMLRLRAPQLLSTTSEISGAHRSLEFALFRSSIVDRSLPRRLVAGQSRANSTANYHLQTCFTFCLGSSSPCHLFACSFDTFLFFVGFAV